MGTPVNTDFGGNRPGRKIKRVKENILSFRCRECEKLQYLTKLEVNRAARPRCTACGGTLIETVTSEDRSIDRNDAVRSARTDGEFVSTPKRRLVGCPSCGERYEPHGLAMHLAAESFCRKEVVKDGLVAQWQDIDFVRYTFRWVRLDTTCKPWTVIALGVDGKTWHARLVKLCDAKRLCQSGNSRDLPLSFAKWELGEPKL